MAIPYVTARSGGEQTTDTTTHTITLPSFTNGQLLLVVIAIDERVTLTVSSGSGWNQLGRIPNGTTTAAVFWKIASGTGDNLTLTSSSSQQSVHNSFAITGGYFVDGNPSQQTSGTINSIIPSDRWDADYLSIAVQTANGVVSGLSAPSGYSNTVLRTPTGSDSATLITAEQAYANITTTIPSATFTGAALPLTFNLPNIHIVVSECDPNVHLHPRVYSREVTDLTATTQTSHSIRMPPNIEVGDLIMVSFACGGNTWVDYNYTVSGDNWDSTDGAENNGASPTSAVYWKVAEANNALTLNTGSAQKSHSIAVCIKKWSRLIENGSIDNFYKYVGGSGTWDQADNPVTPTWKKLLFIRTFAIANSNWYSPATNGFTGFPENGSGGASVAYGDRGLGLDDGIDWGSYTLTENATFWNYQIEGYDINTVEFIGWDGLSFAGTSTGQNITISSVTDIGGNTVSIRSGDLVLLGFASGSTADRALNVSSSGWTQIDTKRYINGTTYDVNMGLWYKVMGDTPDTTVSVTGTLNNADAGAVNIAVYRGVDQTDPIDAVAFTSGTGSTLPQCLPIEYVRSGGLPIQYVAMAAAGTGSLVPGTNWYYITYNQTDTNSISTTMNHSVPNSLKRFIPAAFTGGPTANAGNSWGAYTLNLKPRRNIANTYKWTHEAGTRNTTAYFSTSQVSFTSQTGQKGSQCIRMLPNNYAAIYYTEQIAEKKFWVQARVNVVVTQNPTANSYIGLFGLHNYFDATSEYQNFTVQAEIKTDGRIFFALRHQANSLIIQSNTAYSSNTWNYLAFLCDYSTFGPTPMIFKVNNVEVGSANIYSSLWKAHVLVGKTYEESTQGSRNWNGFVYLDNMVYSANGWPDYPTGKPKVYNGSTWVSKPLKRWNGSAWVEEPMTYFNGTNWEYVT